MLTSTRSALAATCRRGGTSSVLADTTEAAAPSAPVPPRRRVGGTWTSIGSACRHPLIQRTEGRPHRCDGADGAVDGAGSQRSRISCVPQSTQYTARSRRAAAWWVSLHRRAGMRSLTTWPHCTQWATGASLRRWLRLSHELAGPRRPINRAFRYALRPHAAPRAARPRIGRAPGRDGRRPRSVLRLEPRDREERASRCLVATSTGRGGHAPAENVCGFAGRDLGLVSVTRVLLPGVGAEHTWVGARPPAQIALRGSKQTSVHRIALVMMEQCQTIGPREHGAGGAAPSNTCRKCIGDGVSNSTFAAISTSVSDQEH